MTEQEFFEAFTKIVGFNVEHSFDECLRVFEAREKIRKKICAQQQNNWKETHDHAYKLAILNFERHKQGTYLTYDQVRTMTIAELAEFAKGDD